MAAILIADDDPIVRQFAIELLRDSDHAVVEAADGREAVRLIEAMPIDLLVVDMLMPEMDGMETILSVRQTHPGIRILAISSGGQIGASHVLRLATTFGAHATLRKPLQLTTFAGAIDELLSTGASADRHAPVARAMLN